MVFKVLFLLVFISFVDASEYNIDVDQHYKLIWQDEFNNLELNQTVWNYRLLGKRKKAINAKETVKIINNEYLELSLIKKGSKLYSAMISTQNSHEFLYGYFEIKFKLPIQKGLQSAFWLQSKQYGKYLNNVSLSGAEIDILEHNSKKKYFIYNSVYYNAYNSFFLNKQQHKNKLIDYTKWHTCGLLWEKNKYSFFLDRKLIFTTQKGISHYPEYIILSVENTNWTGDVDKNFTKDSFLIDYVRVYKKIENKGI